MVFSREKKVDKDSLDKCLYPLLASFCLFLDKPRSDITVDLHGCKSQILGVSTDNCIIVSTIAL